MDIEEEQERYSVNIGPNQQVAYDPKKCPTIKKAGQNNQIDYDEKDILDQSAFGIVYGGIMNNDINQRVAVKRLTYTLKNLKKKQPNFERQTQILKKLDNPYIIKFCLSYVDPKTDFVYFVYFVTERCQLKILAQQIDGKKKFSSQAKFRYAYQLIYAMKHMHQQGCMHRDIKPYNILLTQEDNIKIFGFDNAGYQKPISYRLEKWQSISLTL